MTNPLLEKELIFPKRWNISSSSPAILNDTLAASFYLYDHLGNTRVVYTPEVQCPTYVTYTIDNATDYYPYGKSLRQFAGGDGPEKFLTTQHERDQETGLDYRGARFYDADIARFNSLDPLAANYPSLSDYSYVVGNPAMYLDPTGMAVEDIYSVDENGTVKLERKTNHDFDIIYKRNDKGQYIEGTAMRVNDQSLLSQLTEPYSYRPFGSQGKKYPYFFTQTSNKEEITKLFVYFAKNTKPEWGLQGFKKEDQYFYTLGTVRSSYGGNFRKSIGNEKYLIWKVHSHPYVFDHDTDRASHGDLDTQDGVVDAFRKKYNQYPYPKAYVYDVKTDKLILYDNKNTKIKEQKVKSYKDLLKILK